MKTQQQAQRDPILARPFGDYLFAFVIGLSISIGYGGALFLFPSDAFRVV